LQAPPAGNVEAEPLEQCVPRQEPGNESQPGPTFRL
jgi:hypothetical protein